MRRRPTTTRPGPRSRGDIRSPADARPAPGTRSPGGAHAGTTVEYDVARLGLPPLTYEPVHDDQPDPGEVVWTWVPYEEDTTRGKDRPVLVLARAGSGLVVAQMTSKDHDRDMDDEARHGRSWIDVGVGAWDSRGRPSEVRVDRLLRVDPADVRRQGAALARERYDEVADALRAHHR
ncbi:MAG: type II toxin-antitoxin system PemK/MazF family toxin [Georgenia sp.]